MKNLIFGFMVCFVLIAAILFPGKHSRVCAEEIVVLFTGDTHGMIYHCGCPIEPDGGIARRASLVKELRNKHKNLLLLDSGAFFAGGVMDEYSQNESLDKERTRITLKGLEVMKYDALALADDEFSFGKKFLLDSLSETKLPVVSCNVFPENDRENIKPFIIKNMAGISVGIIGVTTMQVGKKAEGFKILNHIEAVKNTVAELKKSNVQIIILLSHLGESDDAKLLDDVEGIDILINGHTRSKDSVSRIKATYVLRPSWQGRRLGKAVLKITDKKLIDCAVEEIRVSDKIPDDKQILSFLPQCFSDTACNKEAMKGVCRNPGTMKSSCSFSKAKKIKVTVIRPRQCKTCDVNIQNVSRVLKNHFPGMTMEFLSYPDSKSRKIISESGITHLPAYLLPKDVEGEPDFEIIRDKTDRKGEFFLLKPSISGLSYYLGRKNVTGKFDLFISLYDKSAADVLSVVREFNPAIHLLAVEQKDGFEAAKGNWEVEDDLRAVCVQKYYPRYFWDYLICRAKNIGSSWWEDCLPSPMDPGIIKKCARCEEGKGLLRANIALTQELKLMYGPAYLVDNQEIFMSQGAPNKDELKRVIKGK